MVACAVAISSAAIYITTIGSGGGPPPGQANIWVDQNGGTCVDNASPVDYNDAQACSWDQATDTCDNGDTVLVKGGSTYGDVQMYGWNGRTAFCDFAPAQGENVQLREWVMGSWTLVYASNDCDDSADNTNSMRWLRWTGPIKMGAFQADCSQNVTMDGGSGYAWDMDGTLMLPAQDTCTGDNGTKSCVLQPFHTLDGNISDFTLKHFQVHDSYNSNGLAWIGGADSTYEDGAFYDDINDSYGNVDIHDECTFPHADSNLIIRRVKFWHCMTADILLSADSTPVSCSRTTGSGAPATMIRRTAARRSTAMRFSFTRRGHSVPTRRFAITPSAARSPRQTLVAGTS